MWEGYTIRAESPPTERQEMQSELNLGDLERIVKALRMYQTTTEYEETSLTEYTITRVMAMGIELAQYIQQEYQVKTCGTCDKIVTTKGVKVGSKPNNIYCSKDCAMGAIVKNNREALM